MAMRLGTSKRLLTRYTKKLEAVITHLKKERLETRTATSQEGEVLRDSLRQLNEGIGAITAFTEKIEKLLMDYATDVSSLQDLDEQEVTSFEEYSAKAEETLASAFDYLVLLQSRRQAYTVCTSRAGEASNTTLEAAEGTTPVQPRPVNLLVPLELEEYQSENTKEADAGGSEITPTTKETTTHPYNLRPNRKKNYAENILNTSILLVTMLGLLITNDGVRGQKVRDQVAKITRFIKCIPGGVQLVSEVQVPYQVCAEDFCKTFDSPHYNETVRFPPSIVLHEHKVQWKLSINNAIDIMEAMCPSAPFCESVDCLFCTSLIFNPECWPVGAIIALTVLLYLIATGCYALLLSAAELDGETTFLKTILRIASPQAEFLEPQLQAILKSLHNQKKVATTQRTQWTSLMGEANFLQSSTNEQLMVTNRCLRSATQTKEKILRLGTWYILTDRIYDRQVQANLIPRGRRFQWLEKGKKQEYDVNAESVLKMVQSLMSFTKTSISMMEDHLNKVERQVNESEEAKLAVQCKQLKERIQEIELDWADQVERLERENRALKEKIQEQYEDRQMDWSAEVEETTDGSRAENKEQGKEKGPEQNDDAMDWTAPTEEIAIIDQADDDKTKDDDYEDDKSEENMMETTFSTIEKLMDQEDSSERQRDYHAFKSANPKFFRGKLLVILALKHVLCRKSRVH
ncbi:unnamed protein product [Cylicocyclus nassatus]|uniref:Uncharacterized protein n=1 Tax=Cylicocyclus nassatus TaxID=53992 RepID=A0AA36GF59_CYLNA|nr:unnamed protein product [Cylicocyclus nassatus]